jgi:nicotinate phosphoribosyltransferase
MTIMQVSVPSSLFVDLYELTMAQGFLRKGLGRQRAIFHHFFRRLPWGCSFAVSAGLQPFCQWLSALHFERHQLESLAALRSPSGHPLFEDDFLQTLEHWQCELDLFAMPEGTLSFPHQPLIRVEGPLWQAQLLETALLNIVNFSTLVSSLAIPILEAAAPMPVWEFGARRAQGPNGAFLASRSAWIAGCAGTSLLQASLDLEIPATGTMAHSWVMAFSSEEKAFHAYAELYPHQTSLLIDTLDTEQGARYACQVGDWLRSKGSELLAVRIDSGDLAEQSRRVRKILDEHGLSNTKIILSGDLNAEKIRALHRQGACADILGVGTELCCAAQDPHLTGVYKLAALQQPDGSWKPCAKLGADLAKRSQPGRRTVMRCFGADGRWQGDATVDLLHPESPSENVEIFPQRGEGLASCTSKEDLLTQVMGQGVLLGTLPDTGEVRVRCQEQLSLWKQASRL